jgi:hypothetical protein
MTRKLALVAALLAAACWRAQLGPSPRPAIGAAVFVPANSIRSEAAVRVRPDGTNVPYKAAANTDGAAGAAIAAAANAAVAGDIVYVYRSANLPAGTNLAKNGVNWCFAPVTITSDAAGVGYIFDDSGSARSYSVTGHARFVRKASGVPLGSEGDGDTGGGGTVGVLRAKQPSSVVTFQCDTISLIFAETATNFVWLNGVYLDAGASVTLDIDSLTGDRASNAIYGYVNGVWWSNGNVNGRIGRVYFPSFDTSVLVTAAFQIVSQASPPGECRISSEDIDCDFPVQNSSPSTAVGFWLSAKTIGGLGISAGGKTYITTQKLIGGWSHQGGKLYLDTMKATGEYPANVGTKPIIEVIGGTAWVDVQAFEPTGSRVQELLKVNGSGAVLHFRGADMTGATAAANSSGSNAVLVSAGTANLYSGNIVSDAAKLDLRRTGGTLNVSANLVYDATKTLGTITKLKTYGAAAP